MQELHRRALGGTTGLPGALTAIPPAGAAATLASATMASLAQLAVTGPGAAGRILASICDRVDISGNFDGLEGPFLSALGMALRDGHTQATTRAVRLWQGKELSPQLAGGAPFATMLTGQRDWVALVPAARLAKLHGSLPADAAGIAAALASLRQDDEPATTVLEVTFDPTVPVAGLLDAGRALVAFAGALAAQSVVRRWWLQPPGGPLEPVLDRIVSAL